MFRKILIANRGEIACRVIRTAQALGIDSVAVYSDADAEAQHVALADEAWRLGPPPVGESYLRADKILEIAKHSGAEAIHPGYGFLSENAAFAEACEDAGIVFIGPPASAIRAMGLKDAAKALMEKAGVPVVPGYHGAEQAPGPLAAEAARIGYPVLIKAVAGGGGKGMRLVETPEAFAAALKSARREARNAFGDPRVLIEKYVTQPRHLEIQVFADGKGQVVYLFERDCSLQRRHQKVVEEAPAPGMPAAVRRAMGEAAVRAALAIGYRGAGTVEFIADGSTGLREDSFWFMEMNTRLQVEHPVTEMITGQDLVAWQLQVAAGGSLPLAQDRLAIAGHAFEARIYAEDPARDFLPAVGLLERLRFPRAEPGIRIDSGVTEGDRITPHYDPMIAKLIVHGANRQQALARLARALAAVEIDGCITNVGFLGALARHAGFAAGAVDTGLIGRDIAQLLSGNAERDDDALTAAVLFAAGALEEVTEDNPWTQLTGFRLWGGARQVVSLDIGGVLQEARVDFNGKHYRLFLPQAEVTVRVAQRNPGCAILDFGTRRKRIDFSPWHGGVTIFCKGRALRFGLPDRLTGDSDTAGAGNKVLAPMSGRILLVKVAPGEAIAKGQVLLVEEAMKMEHSLAAPRDGVVAAVTVAEGDQVDEGAVLVTLEDEEAA
ncbi:MAG: acetyl/propionyl/methylcrotonyl-CoA carboxylase subunit alpha [Rhodospirillales bacterium]|nr:acetyl/propionyl/methylcrotonyl-CoA carboxylase subunit alpha [Rhodospirillales bacterium]